MTEDVIFVPPTNTDLEGKRKNTPEFIAEKANFPAKRHFPQKKQADSAENKCGG